MFFTNKMGHPSGWMMVGHHGLFTIVIFVIKHLSYMVAGINGGSGDVSNDKLRIWILCKLSNDLARCLLQNHTTSTLNVDIHMEIFISMNLRRTRGQHVFVCLS